MNDAKYIGLDVHQATISAAVLDSSGKLVMESILETKAATILQFVHGLRGSLHVTLEEGTCASWLHDLLKPRRERERQQIRARPKQWLPQKVSFISLLQKGGSTAKAQTVAILFSRR